MGSAPGLDPRFADLAADFGLIRATMPAIVDLQQKGKLVAAIEEEKVRGKNLIFDQYQVLSTSVRAPRRPRHRPAC